MDKAVAQDSDFVFGNRYCGPVLGYFGNSATASGYGFYSMNMTAPFCGGPIFPCFTDATGGQYEGYNYLGAGLIMLIPFAILAQWPLVKSWIRRYPALLLSAILLTMYALSNKIYVGSYKLIEVQLPGWTDVITGTFRSSGRLFWMAGYLILFGVLSAVLRKRSHLTILLLLFALVIQWVDTQPRRDHIIFSASQPGKVHFVSWEKLMNRINTINFYPAFGCGAADPQDYLYLQLIAANSGKHFNTGYSARQEPDCIVKNQIFEEPFQSQQLYVSLTSYLKKNYFGIPAGFREAIENRQCLTFGSYVICQNGLNLVDWSNAGFQIESYPKSFVEEVHWSAGELPTRIRKVAMIDW